MQVLRNHRRNNATAYHCVMIISCAIQNDTLLHSNWQFKGHVTGAWLNFSSPGWCRKPEAANTRNSLKNQILHFKIKFSPKSMFIFFVAE